MKNDLIIELQDDILFHKPTYKELNVSFMNNFITDNINNSNMIDVIGIYIKGQKILYTEAKTICEQRLTYLMLPSILFTILSSIINLMMDDIYGKYITVSLNGLITFILTMINYLKLDARAEAHRGTAYKYDKLLTYIEFQSCKQLFLGDEKKNMREVFIKIEKDIIDIKDTNQFILPEIIRYQFPILSSINIFSEIKQILNVEMIEMTELVYLIQEINNTEDEIKKKELEHKKQEKIIKLLEIQNHYIHLDTKFKEELSSYSKHYNVCNWLKV